MHHQSAIGFLLALLATLALNGCTGTGGGQWKQAAKPSDFPCLSYTHPCGKATVRPVVKKTLEGPLAGNPDRGRMIAFARKRGNCLACHRMIGGTQAGTRGPNLTRYGATGRSDAEIYAMVYDMRWRFPDTVMPPIGTNGILSEQEIRDVVAFLQASR